MWTLPRLALTQTSNRCSSPPHRHRHTVSVWVEKFSESCPPGSWRRLPNSSPTRRPSSVMNGAMRGTGGQSVPKGGTRLEGPQLRSSSRIPGSRGVYKSRATAVTHYSFCLKEDHASAMCPCNPTHQSSASHQRSPPGRQPCCSHQPPTYHRLPTRWRFARGSMTSIASFLAAAFTTPVCCAADPTPTGCAGHSNDRGADHQVAIGARARWPNGTNECSGHTRMSWLPGLVTVHPDCIIGYYL